MTGKDVLSIDDLYGILKNNELENFDPVTESFKYLDPQGIGQVNMERLKELFSFMGYGDLTENDLKLILEVGDTDEDGAISL